MGIEHAKDCNRLVKPVYIRPHAQNEWYSFIEVMDTFKRVVGIPFNKKKVGCLTVGDFCKL